MLRKRFLAQKEMPYWYFVVWPLLEFLSSHCVFQKFPIILTFIMAEKFIVVGVARFGLFYGREKYY